MSAVFAKPSCHLLPVLDFSQVTFTHVIINSLLTVATMQGVFTWNDFINAYTFTRSTNMKTVTLGLNDFVGFMGTTDWGATFAAITVTVLPTFLFYFFTNKVHAQRFDRRSSQRIIICLRAGKRGKL